jgi:L-ascorbate metabolism protein UlaG (beta-lactamase superfamily)
VKIKWYGHACFLMTSSAGTRVLTDPFDETVGYPVPSVEADYVTVSHDHFDHNAVRIVKGQPKVAKGPGTHRLGDIEAKGVGTFHDDVRGAKRGLNTVFVFDIDGIRVCHLGDLGHVPGPEQVSEIGGVDVLLVPVGGTYTIDAGGAASVTGLLAPRIVIPMHFKTPALSFPLDPVDSFLQRMGGGTRTGAATLEVSKEDLGGPRRICVLEYA